MRQEPKLFSSGNAAPPPQDGFHVEPRRPAPSHHERDDDRPSRRHGFPWRLLLGIVVLAVVGIGAWKGAGMLSGPAGSTGQDVPLFEASLDPFKHRPDDPGGLAVPNQNVTVYDTMDPDENADGMEQLLPEPEEPIVIAPEVAEPDAMAAEDGVIDVEAASTAEIGTEEGAEPIFSADDVTALVDEAMSGAQGDIPVPGVKPVAPVTSESTVNEIAASEPEAGDSGSTGGGLSFSDVAAALGDASATSEAPAQPATTQTTETTTAAPETSLPETSLPETAAVAETTAAEVPAAATGGDYWVQIAAYSSREAAGSAWERLARANPDLLGSATPRVMETSVAGTTLHRLQVGSYASQGQAQSLCDALQKRTGDQCLIVGP